MKKLVMILVLWLGLVGLANADQMYEERFEDYGNTAAQYLDASNHYGVIGWEVIIKASADDTIVVTITTEDGYPVWTGTTSAASSTGETLSMGSVYIPKRSKIAFGVSSGTIDAIFSYWK